ncbi:tripartite tricarboxylate transporter substrate binding protein [Ramlibacter ginsenosidimutans]|uniref:Tripartite tricarboxylate transporter substrate binding protein n=1 Tax=Ramlibacter ginsenosidimutans TaxID=502333 RepID=A0A934TWK3_9BURK|nr:tripartite tricarboxylate transporter substrate binding protein [Ramlibacter ginsenosidimutans]MBK6008260.1 tripartite tricarboxylate transporter substrate binding protein [Ramlibacter ginsenosidimutans]
MNLKLSRRQALALLAAAAAPWTRAQSKWPARPVRIVVPFGAGGVADLTVRAVGDQLARQLGQAVVIDNKPGAGGIVAGSTVLQAPPDGYTLFLMSNGTAVSEGLFNKLPFHARTDFAPISLLGTFDIAVVVPENSRFRSLGDLLAEAKAKPGKLNVATIAAGSTQNLAAELFKTTAGIDVQIVPFNGTPQVVTALRGGEVDAAVEIVAPILSQIQAKALRALATFGEKRSTTMPGVPTASEVGGSLKGLYIASWNALAAPAKTPQDVVARLNHECVVALANPEVKRKLADLGVDAKSSTPQQLASLLDSETRRWGGVIERAKIPKM